MLKQYLILVKPQDLSLIWIGYSGHLYLRRELRNRTVIPYNWIYFIYVQMHAIDRTKREKDIKRVCISSCINLMIRHKLFTTIEVFAENCEHVLRNFCFVYYAIKISEHFRGLFVQPSAPYHFFSSSNLSLFLANSEIIVLSLFEFYLFLLLSINFNTEYRQFLVFQLIFFPLQKCDTFSLSLSHLPPFSHHFVSLLR